MSSGAGYRCGLNLVLLLLWCRLGAAPLIQSLAGELPYTAGMILKRKIKHTHTYLHTVPLEIRGAVKKKKRGAVYCAGSQGSTSVSQEAERNEGKA